MVLSIKGEEIDAINAAGLSNKLLQMANGAVYGEEKKVLRIHDRKLEALEDLVEAANGKPLLVVYWYKHDLARIRERFDVRTIDTSKDIDDWNAGKIPVALIHPASAGHGLNLQEGGSTVVWFGLTWSLELYQQLNARLWRQGQKNTVVIQHIITRGTHDEDVMRALEAKDMRQSALIEAVKADYGSAIFKLIEYYPLTKPLTLVIVVMIMLWFVTSSDSASLVIDMLTAGGDTNPPKIQRLFWALSQGVIAAVLLVAGGLSALQAVAIIAGFPFAIVVFVMMYCLWRGLTRDRLTLYRNQQWYITAESAEHNSANEFIDEHLLLGPPVVVKDKDD